MAEESHTTPAPRVGRPNDELRAISLERGVAEYAEGSCLVAFGKTRVLCTATIEKGVPGWRRGSGLGWLTAEYAMLPRATRGRTPRERTQLGGRTQEIQRLIGRSLRAVFDLQALGERTITVDCDVLQADGGTRTASICGAWVALHDACARLVAAGSIKNHPLTSTCTAISVGIVDGTPVLDLPYVEDSRAETDMNVVMTGSGKFVEVQGTAEGAPFDRAELGQLLDLAAHGCSELTGIQSEVLSR